MASLDATLGDTEDAPTLGELLADGQNEYLSVDERGRVDTRLDMVRALSTLTEDEQRLCLLLGEQGLSITEAAKVLGLPRSTVYERIARIRKIFEEEGLQHYLRT